MSVIERDLRRRVERILRGERIPVDLITLFLSQRDKPHARPVVTEMGDFIAHRDERVRGETHRHTRAIFRSARVLGMEETAEPEVLGEAYEGSLETYTDERLKELTGMERAIARSMLGRCKAKGFGRKRDLNPKEKSLLATLKEPYTRPVFSPEELVADFAGVLTESGILRRDERDGFQAAADFIIAFAVSVIHGTEIALGDGISVAMVGHSGAGVGVQIWARLPMVARGREFDLMVPAFFTALKPEEHCTPALARTETWRDTVELVDGGLLDFVR